MLLGALIALRLSFYFITSDGSPSALVAGSYLLSINLLTDALFVVVEFLWCGFFISYTFLLGSRVCTEVFWFPSLILFIEYSYLVPGSGPFLF
jgi:hypothetical protein